MSNRLTEIQATVIADTAKSLNEMSDTAKMSIGEVIDRLTLRFTPDDYEIAANIVETEILMIFSKLPEAEVEKGLRRVTTDLLAMLVKNENDWQEIRRDTAKARADMIAMAKEEDLSGSGPHHEQ